MCTEEEGDLEGEQENTRACTPNVPRDGRARRARIFFQYDFRNVPNLRMSSIRNTSTASMLSVKNSSAEQVP
jgi:hypothetical protein